MMIDTLCDAYYWITGWHIYSFDDPTLVWDLAWLHKYHTISGFLWHMIIRWFSISCWHMMINKASTSLRYFLGFVYMYVYGMSSVCKTETYPLVIQHSYEKSPFIVSFSHRKLVIVHSYVSLPEGSMSSVTKKWVPNLGQNLHMRKSTATKTSRKRLECFGCPSCSSHLVVHRINEMNHVYMYIYIYHVSYIYIYIYMYTYIYVCM